MRREHPLSWHRVLPLALVAILAALAFAAIAGPRWYRRMYYPLRYEAAIRESARASRLDPYLVTAVVHTESGFDPDIVSKRGAVGLMQVMPETAEDVLGTKRRGTATADGLKEPKLNLDVGCRYLRQLIDRYRGDQRLALAAYNAGIVNADRWRREGGESIDFPQTSHYVDKVLRERDTYARLYPGVFR